MKHRGGFTIIEAVLFLAISGGLVVSLLVGTNMAIQRQRYRDSVQSFASFLRGQYEQVISVENDRTVDMRGKCPVVGGGPNRGQSDCVIVGRYLESQDDYGKSYVASPIYAWEEKSAVNSQWKYVLGEPDLEYTLNWDAKTRMVSQADGSTNVAIVMHRDPELGTLSVKPAQKKYSSSNIGDFFSDPAESMTSSDQDICVYNNGWMTGERLLVTLGARSGSSDTITVNNAKGSCNED